MAVVSVLVAVLVLLAVLQYRWSDEISRAERARIEASLNTSVNQFRQEFYRELVQVCSAFHNDPGAEPDRFPQTYTERFQAWSRTALRTDLVANVYVWQADGPKGSRLFLLHAGAAPSEMDWPGSLRELRTRLEDEAREPRPGMEVRLFAWTFEERIPALVHAVSDAQPGWRRNEGRPGPPHISGFIIIELNAGAIRQQFGELAQRYFGGPDGFTYNVAILGASGNDFLYRSDPELTRASFDRPDARAPLVGPGPEFRGGPGEPAPRPRNARPGFGRMYGQRPRGAMIVPSPSGENWEILVRHRAGSLESVVAANRMRNLLLSFGILLVLGGSVAMLIVSAQRARRLAHLQMEFVAGVSHELRTPVTVICSAADNLADGLVNAKEQVKEYGGLIRNEGRRLAGMVEQILHFASGQAGGTTYDLKPVSVADAVSAALENVSGLPDAVQFTVDREIEPGLPHVQADGAALTRCIQNLILNALKYGGENRWARVRAARSGDDPERVRISVEDHGMGIDDSDLPHIFEPFYRGKDARAAQIHGAGLGLSLAREIAEAMQGTLSAESHVGRGSVFTLELRTSAQAAEELPRTA
ncbi:MAG: HAMP domain-containing sensor histidine kinase [Bryobacteraceae bacterium]